LVNFLQSVIDLNPGTLSIRINLAHAIPVAAAGTVEQALGASGQRTDGGCSPQNAVSALDADLGKICRRIFLSKKEGV
jgi:hypothetical protein